jgi:hypothetical protein
MHGRYLYRVPNAFSHDPGHHPSGNPSHPWGMIPALIPALIPTPIPTLIPTLIPALIPTLIPALIPTIMPTIIPAITLAVRIPANIVPVSCLALNLGHLRGKRGIVVEKRWGLGHWPTLKTRFPLGPESLGGSDA